MRFIICASSCLLPAAAYAHAGFEAAGFMGMLWLAQFAMFVHLFASERVHAVRRVWWLLSFVLLVFLPIPVAFLALVALGEEIGPPLAVALLCVSGAGPFVEWMYFMLASREPRHQTTVQ